MVTELVIDHDMSTDDSHTTLAVCFQGLSLCKKKFNPINSTTFVLFGKYCLIVDQLGSKDSSRDFQLNWVISYFLPTFNILCKRLKIDVTERVKKLGI
jgi:hypothetical protein